MSRTFLLLLLGGVLAAVGCRAFDDRAAVFPRLRDAVARDDNYADRFRDRYAAPPAMATNPCVPCSGLGTSYPGGMTLGMPTMVGGGYGMPLTYSPGVTSPTLGMPSYPSGEGTPYRPRREDELPAPGGYSQPGAAEMGRSVAPKPPTSLPTGK